ncbi:hypothetical protein LINPERPRIM_LOCUS5708 [Linum perenne]
MRSLDQLLALEVVCLRLMVNLTTLILMRGFLWVLEFRRSIVRMENGMMEQLRLSLLMAIMLPMMDGETKKRWILTMLDQLKPMP